MLGDLLPLSNEKDAAGALLRFELPVKWNIAASALVDANGQYRVADMEKAVFFAGLDVRSRQQRVGRSEPRYSVADRHEENF